MWSGFRRLDAALFGEELVRALGKSGGDVLVRKALNNDLAEWLKLLRDSTEH